jgi:hypothetical protein
MRPGRPLVSNDAVQLSPEAVGAARGIYMTPLSTSLRFHSVKLLDLRGVGGLKIDMEINRE